MTHLSATGAGVTVLSHLGANGDGLQRGLVHPTNEVSSGSEDLQRTVGEGPWLDAFATGGPVSALPQWRWVRRRSSRSRWKSAWCGSVRWTSSATCPVRCRARRTPTLLADLVHDLDGHATEDLSWLADPHAEVHQASGMVQVQLGSTTEVALLRLRSCAFQHELSATEVAHQVVPRRLRFTEDDPAQPGGGGRDR